MLGFKYVFDTTFAADLTIMEEANELVNRVKNNGKLPMFTSCCPAWIKYAEQFYPDIFLNKKCLSMNESCHLLQIFQVWILISRRCS